ncbi:MAG: TraB/GumN family protein [Sphingobium sp.]
MALLTRLTLSVLSILLLTSPGFAPIGARTVQTGTTAKPALWVVRDADTTVYLFGTIHVLRPDVRWFHGRVKRAFDRADTLVLEVIPPDPAEAAAITARLALDPDGPPLSTKLDAATRARYLALLNTFGMPAAQLETARPWFAAITLSLLPIRKLGYQADAGVEDVLHKAADHACKTVLPLEGFAEQIGFFASLSDKTQIAFLSASIDDAAHAETEIGRMVAEWSAGRPEALADDLNESFKDMPEVAETLLHARNRRWADWIGKRMARPGTIFLAVGAGHLAGDGSVLDELAARGMTAKRVE